jgi:xanthine dehydrogenase accessory factor
VYGISLSVAACLRAGTRVDVAWIVASEGLEGRDKGEALALTPGGGRVGTLLGGALDDQLAELSARGATRGRLVDLRVADVDALVAGLPSGGHARCLLVPAVELPADLWSRLDVRLPVGLVSRLAGDEVVTTELLTAETVSEVGDAVAGAAGDRLAEMFARRTSETAVLDDVVITVLWPVPQLVIVGLGPVAEALAPAAALLGWHTRTVNEPVMAAGLIATLAAPDKVVVASHDQELAGRALAAALESDVGYIGALGGRRVQQTRADWLAYRGYTELDRIHGPAGLDIGADSPAEIALSILAEAVAVQAGVAPAGAPSPSLPARDGP